MAKMDKARRPGVHVAAAGVAAMLANLLPMVSAEAALPPDYQRQAELQSILANGDVQAQLQEQPIDAIERVGEDLYQVRSGECTLEVRIVDDLSAEPMPGPREFLVDVGEVVCQ